MASAGDSHCCSQEVDPIVNGPNAEEIRRWQVRLRALKSECGCVAASLAFLLGLAVYVPYFLYMHATSYSGSEKAFAGFIILFSSAAIGKILGILFARYRYYVLKQKLATKLPTLGIVLRHLNVSHFPGADLDG